VEAQLHLRPAAARLHLVQRGLRGHRGAPLRLGGAQPEHELELLLLLQQLELEALRLLAADAQAAGRRHGRFQGRGAAMRGGGLQSA